MNPSSSTTCSKRKRDSSYFDDDDDEPESSSKRPKNDVFINYSSEEIGKIFISHLRAALIRNSFAISDHTNLPVGQDMRLELLKAIEESEMYVVVFSPDYASSVRCLDELVDIMDCFNEFDERKVVPVFYKVEPSDVRNQQGPFLEPFQAHHTNTNLDPQRVQKWRQALKLVGQLCGLTLQNGDEAEFVLKVVEELEKMQRPQELHVTDHPVGIASRAEELISTLRLDRKDLVLVVAVFGISGIGKTTIVKEVYNRVARNFDLACFLDIHSICQVPYWKAKLQKALISCLTYGNTFSIMSNHNEGVTKIKKLVSHRKVLLVLDDVDNFQQLESLGICPKWFYEGSRIIVTTRDKRSLGNIQYVPYHTMLLNRRESLNLFTRLMFVGDGHVNPKFIKEVVSRAGGIPLVLKVWSSHFQQYEREQWPSILETLKRIPHGDVQKQLRLSYDALSPRLKKLFLDIACFFNSTGEDTDLIVKVLQDEDLGFFPKIEIKNLVDKSLVEITSENKLRMHHAIKEMGQEIVRQENEDEPGQRTRLQDERDVMRVLTECSGTKSVESIVLEANIKNMPNVNLEAFRKMSNLKLIMIKIQDSFDGDKYLKNGGEMTELYFRKLKYMYWYYFPLKSLDSIEMCNVVVLKLVESKLERLWEGMKSLKKLRILDVSCAWSLTKTGNFSGLENLEELHLAGCHNLKELDSSIGNLQKLAILDLSNSIPLKGFPWEIIGNLSSLQKLTLGNNVGIESLDMELFSDEGNDPTLYSFKEAHVKTLEPRGRNQSKISGEVVRLACLKHLYLYNVNFSSHCDILLQLHHLNTIELKKCDRIQSIPNLPGNITSIRAENCSSLVNLPWNNISELKSLTALHLIRCPKLGSEDPHILMKVVGLTNLTHLSMVACGVSQVPSEIWNLVSLKELDLSSNPLISSLPDTLSNISQLLYLNISKCHQLRLLPLLPPNLTYVDARKCGSLDVPSSAARYIRTKVCKESTFGNRFIMQLSCRNEVPDWCSYQNGGDVLSFVAPLHLDNKICGIILCVNTPSIGIIIPKMYNKTKNTSHRFKANTSHPSYITFFGCMCVMWYPLDATTLMVEPGDSVVLKLPDEGLTSSCGLRLIYESDVVDSVFQTPSESTPHITQSHAIPSTSHGDDYICSDDDDGGKDDYDAEDDGDDYDDYDMY